MTEQEMKLAKLPPGTATNPKLSTFKFDCASELMNCKLRMEYRKWEEHDEDAEAGLEEMKWAELQDEEKMLRAEQDANLRQIYDPINGVMNFSKKKVTDSRHNTKVGLPREASSDHEMYINLCRNRYKSVYQV